MIDHLRGRLAIPKPRDFIEQRFNFLEICSSIPPDVGAMINTTLQTSIADLERPRWNCKSGSWKSWSVLLPKHPSQPLEAQLKVRWRSGI